MTDAPPPFRIRRLLVALDASPQSLSALAAAAALAARTGAEMAGLFVEDVDLLRLAGQGAGRLVDAQSAAPRQAPREEMQRSLDALAVRAQRALAEAAAREGVRWTFRVAHGRVAAEILAAAEDADLVCLGRASWSGGRGVRLGATARSVVSTAPHSVLVVRERDGGPWSVAVVFDGGAATRRALAAAASLAIRDGGRVLVLLPRVDVARQDGLRREAAEILRGTEVEPDFRVLADASPQAVARALADPGDVLLVVARESPERTEASCRLVAVLGRSVLLVR